MKRKVGVLAVWLAVATMGSGCAKTPARAESGEPRPPTQIEAEPRAERPIVYLHGMCADPKEHLAVWGHVAKKFGPVVTLMGDIPCPDKPGMFKWSLDAADIDRRIDDAVGASKPLPGEIILVGESMGAARAELLAAKFPDKYTRLVLVGSPQTPSPQNLRGAKAVATLAGENEPQSTMKEGARALEHAGTPTRFWKIPDAIHGEYGPEGERVMNEALAFVATR